MYRWWTVFAWWNACDLGVKVGPLTLAVYLWDGQRIPVVTVLQRVLVDRGLRIPRWWFA